MKDNRKIKTVSFNVLDEHEFKLLEHAERINKLTGKARNFSKYVKQLIERDLNGSFQNNVVAFNQVQQIDDDFESKEIKDAMSSFL